MRPRTAAIGSSNTWSRTSTTSSTSDQPGTIAQVRRQAGGAVRLIHPFPSLLDALITAGLVLLAGAGLDRAGLLGGAMLCLQASIGGLNDLLDLERDRATKPAKPLPRGLLSRRSARAIVVAGLVAGLGLSLLAGPVPLLVGVLGLTVGYLYDARLKTGPWSWLPFAIGLPLLPVYAWVGATGELPGSFLVLVPTAIVGGAALALANELADDERDRAGGVRTAVGALGRARAWRRGALLQGLVASVALGSLVIGEAPILTLAAAAGSVGLILLGLVVGRSTRAELRERAWEAQAIGLGGLAIAWLGGLASRGHL
ncbi:MAG: UbiA family prenyltransferase [Candidatus Limnocylindrales bacterium]